MTMSMAEEQAFLLPPSDPELTATQRSRLESDYHRFRDALPGDVQAHCLEAYRVDIAGEYAGQSTRNPFGKASGQLSLNVRQVARDAEAGLGFVVLKTVVAEDEHGEQRMAAWAVRETRMRVERIVGEEGTPGWTVTWKGRGWHESLESYCRFFGDALDVAGEAGMPLAPSVKFHLPPPGDNAFAQNEYQHTTQQLLAVWRSRCPASPMPLEKDFSPTLAGDDLSREREQILHWLRTVPGLIYEAAQPETGAREDANTGACPVRLGVKLMNAREDLSFQIEMLRVLVDETPRGPDFLIYANRLFGPGKEFEGKLGMAYGGPDLSRRNLLAMRAFQAASRLGAIRRASPPISGTGDILTGKMAVEYGLAGASSCQLHTLFQLPEKELGAAMRNRSAAVLHHLLFHPMTGVVAWLLHLAAERGARVDWLDLPGVGRERLAGG